MSDRQLKLEIVMKAVDRALAPIRALSKGSSELAGNFRAAQQELSTLNRANARIEAFRKTSAEVAIVSNTLKQATGRVAELKTEMAASESPTKAQTRALQLAIIAAGQLKDRYQALQEKQQRLRTEMDASGTPTRNLAQAQIELRRQIASTTENIEQQRRALQEQGRMLERVAAAKAKFQRINSMASKVRQVGAQAALAGGLVLGAAAVPLNAYAQAEDAATGLKVALMGTGGTLPKELAEINELANRLGNRLPGTTADYQNMMTMLVRQGMSAKSILGGLGEATAYLAVQLKMPTDAAAEFASKLQDATRTSEGDMLRLMDVIQRTFYLGVDSNNMLDGFAKLSPALQTIRMSGLAGAQALAPLLVLADQAGMKGEAAGNAFRKVFQFALDAKKLGKANAALKGSGFALDFSDGKGEFGGLDKLFGQLDKLKSLNTMKRGAVIKELFGDDAETLQVVSLLIDKGRAGYEEVQAKMAAQADIQRRVNEQLGTLKNLWDAAKGTFTNALAAFGEAIAPEAKALTQWLTGVAESTQRWAKENPGLANALMTIVKWVGVFLASAGGLAIALGTLAAPIAVLAFAIGGLGLSLGPVLLVIGAVGLLGTAAVALIRYWEPISGFFSGLWGEARAAFNGGILGISSLILNWSPIGLFHAAFATVLSWFGIDIPTKFTDFGAMMIRGLISGIQSVWGELKSLLNRVVDWLPDSVREKLGIRSPSRVFAEIGGYTMEGLQQGIERGGPGALSAMRNMAGQVVLAGAVASNATANVLANEPPISRQSTVAASNVQNKYEIHIHAAPGMDAESVAQAVARELDRRDRQRSAQRRSSLLDID